jgi:hypothetical protein
MNQNRVRILFVLLLLIGLFVTLFGMVGGLATGAAFADHFVPEMGLPRDPEVYSKVAGLYAESIERSSLMTFILGLVISIPAAVGCWEARRIR